MTYRRASRKERARTGKAHIVTGRGTPPPAPWSIEAVAAYDKTALRRELPPMIAQNLRRIDNGGPLIGKFDLYLPYWHATLRGCSWFTNHVDAAWVRVPATHYTDRHGKNRYTAAIDFDDIYSQRFEEAAFAALEILLDSEPPRFAPEPDDQPQQEASVNGPALYVVSDPEDIPF
jgi:hypothetical protein